jgi:hypothetical protein
VVCSQVEYRGGAEYSRRHVWSDGAPTQFKSKTAWYLRSKSPIPTVHNYFGAGHGKGEHDGAGANIKHQVALAMMSSATVHKLLSAHDYYVHCSEQLCTPVQHVHASHQKKLQLSSREFYWVPSGTVLRKNDQYSSVRGIRQYHCYRTAAACAGEVVARSLSCYCDACYACDWDACVEQQFTGEWKAHTIVLRPAGGEEPAAGDGAVSDQEEPGRPDVHDADDVQSVMTLCCAGDVVAVLPPSDEDEMFFLMKVTAAPKQVTARQVKARDGTVFVRGDVVVAGKFYTMDIASFNDPSIAELHYRINKHVDTVYAHQLFKSCVRLPWQASMKRFVLPEDEYDNIMDDLEALDPC